MQKTSVCEVCNKSLIGSDYLLCPDRPRAFTIVLEALPEPKPMIGSCLKTHPELTPDDLYRVSEVFKWRKNRLGLAHVTPKIAGG